MQNSHQVVLWKLLLRQYHTYFEFIIDREDPRTLFVKEFTSRRHFNMFFPKQLSVTAYVERNPTFSLKTVNLNSLSDIF